MAGFEAKLYLVTYSEQEYIAIITDKEFLDDILSDSDCEVVEAKDLDGDFSNWPVNRLLCREM
jgi:hypothetical protein